MSKKDQNFGNNANKKVCVFLSRVEIIKHPIFNKQKTRKPLTSVSSDIKYGARRET